MAIVKFTNAYATIAEIDGFFPSICQWTNLTDDEKEAFIIAASNLIDESQEYEGEVATDGQAMKFLRNFDTTEKLFSEATQTSKLIMAVAHQVNQYLQNIPLGNGGTYYSNRTE